MNIIARRTHYEIHGYMLGSYPKIEEMFYIWDQSRYQRTNYYYYDEDEQILYLPRGLDPLFLKNETGLPVVEDTTYNPSLPATFNVMIEPRDSAQKESVRFLLGKNEYVYTKNSSQLVLSLPGGGGKTYCMVSAMSFFRMKSIIIVHNEKIRSQWVDRIQSYTNLPKSSINVLTSTEKTHQFMSGKKSVEKELSKSSCFICTHRLLTNYISKYGFHSLNELFIKLGIGIKIIDEAHKEFKSTLMLDYATNVGKTFYLTATFKRSDYKEDTIYQRSFHQVYKLVRSDEEIGHERNVKYVAYLVKSNISPVQEAHLTVRKRFNVHRYFEFEMDNMELFSTVSYWLDWYYNKNGFTGKAFVLSSKKDSCDLCDKIAKTTCPDKKSSVHYTGNKVDISEYDIISATDMMLGTGTDLGDLNLIINLVPIGSSANIDQIIHRLMRGNNMDDAYYIEGIDASVSQVVRMFQRRVKVIRKIVKKALVFNKQYDDKKEYDL